MPACIAHYQFGQDILSRLDGGLRSAATAFRQEFGAGLQGPDIFFFYKPWRRTGIRQFGIACHSGPGSRMFAPILEKMREKAALSYLLGLICHYVLDSRCHPYVYGYSREFMGSRRTYDHQRMESAFDRHVMSVSGLTCPRYRYLPAGRLDYGAMASLWPGITAAEIRKSVETERRAIRLLDRRKFLEACEAAAGRPGGLTPMTLPDTVPPEQAEHVRNLSALYNDALALGPELIRTALQSMKTSAACPPGFESSFKGEIERPL